MQRTLKLVVDDGLQSPVRVRDRAWKNQPERPGGEHVKERGVTTEERAKVVAGCRQHEVQEYGSTVYTNADRQPVRKATLGLLFIGSGGQPRQRVDRHRAWCLREVANLLRRGREPVQLGVRQHG